MANVKVTELTALAAADSASTDVLPVVDVSADATKKLAISDLHRSVPDGTLSAPGIAFQSDLNSGLYRSGTDAIALVTNGAARILIDATGNVTIPNDLTVQGATTFITGQTVLIEDKNIELGVVTTPTDVTADGGGITLKGATDKTIQWIDSTNAWTFNKKIIVQASSSTVYAELATGGTAYGEVVNLTAGSTATQNVTLNLRPSNGGTETQGITIRHDGKVGIGTEEPDELMHISKASGTTLYKASVAGNSTIGLEIVKTGATTQSWRIVDGQTVNGKLEFYDVTGSATRMCIDGAGNIGIGTVSPSRPLDVVSNSSAETLTIRGASANNISTIRFASNDAATNYGYIQSRPTYLELGTQTAIPLQFATNGSPRLTITSTGNAEFNGNVGVNTSSFPANGKNLKVSDGTISRLVLEKTGTGARVFEVGVGNSFLNVYDATADEERIRIDNNGNVGVGLNNPSYEFHVKGAGTVAYFEGTGGNGFIGIEDADDGSIGFIGVDGGNIKFQTSGASYADSFVITSTGNAQFGGQIFADSTTGAMQISRTNADAHTIRTGISSSIHPFFVLARGSTNIHHLYDYRDDAALNVGYFTAANNVTRRTAAFLTAKGTWYLGNNGDTTTSNFKTKLGEDGTATFANRVDVGGLTVDSNLTPSSGASIEAFYNNGGFIQAYDRDAPGFTSLRIKSSNYELGSDGSAEFAGGNVDIAANGFISSERLFDGDSATSVLEINSSEGKSLLRGFVTGNGTDSFNISQDGSATFAGHIDIGPAGGNQGKLGYSSNDLFFGTSSSAGEFIFKNNVTSTDSPADSGSERMRITSTGTVLIGGTSTAENNQANIDANGTLTSRRTSISDDCFVAKKEAETRFLVQASGSVQIFDTSVGFVSYDNEFTAVGDKYAQLVCTSSEARITAGSTGTDNVPLVFRTANAGTEAERARITHDGDTVFIKQVNDTEELAFGYGTSSGIYAGIGGKNNFGTNQLCELVFFTNGSAVSRAPSQRMKIAGSGESRIFSDSGTSTIQLHNASSSGTTHRLLYGLHSSTSYNDGTAIYSIFTNGTVGTPSDIRLKKNVETTRDGYLADLASLRVVKYHWKTQEDSEPKELGLIAQEVEEVFPGLIHTEGEGDDEVKEIKRSVIPYMLLKALQEANAKIESLETRIAALES